MSDNIQQLYGDYVSNVDPPFAQTPLKGLRKLAQQTQYAPACTDTKCGSYNQTEISGAVTVADMVFVCLGTGMC